MESAISHMYQRLVAEELQLIQCERVLDLAMQQINC